MASNKRLLDLKDAFESEENYAAVAVRCLDYLDKSEDLHEDHTLLCSAMVRRVNGGNKDLHALLFYLGEAEALSNIYGMLPFAW